MRRIQIPIYNVTLWLAVIRRKQWNEESRAAWRKVFKKEPKEALCEESAACHAYMDGDFMILVKEDGASLDAVGHEVFHLTHRILEYCGDYFVEQHHEPAAYLHGYLLKVVVEEVQRQGRALRGELEHTKTG